MDSSSGNHDLANVNQLLGIDNPLMAPQPLSINLSPVSAPAIPIVEDGLLRGDANNDGGLTHDDVTLILQDRNKPLVGVDDPRDYDVDGKISIFDTRKLGLAIQQNKDLTAPNFSASLSNDTAVNGGKNSDSITADPTVSGVLTDASRITRIRAGLDTTNTANFLNIRGVVNTNGSFTLTPDQLKQINQNTALSQGQHTLSFFVKDQWNNATNFNLTFTLDSNSPLLNVALANDTGNSQSDKITKDSSITGNISDLSQIVTFKAGFDSTPTENFVNVLGTLQGNGSFAFNTNKIIEINGNNPLTEGQHTIKLIAADVAGNAANLDFTFTFDTTLPLTPTVDLLASSDSGFSNSDNLTNDNTPTLGITAEAGSTVKLLRNGIEIGQAATNSSGLAEFTLETLTDGTYNFTATATDAAGNTSNLSTPLTVNIDTTAPTLPQFNLDPAFDSVPVGDGVTTFETVTLIGQTEPDKQITLVETGTKTTSDQLGQFQLTNIALALGDNSFTVQAIDAAGNVSQNTSIIQRIPLIVNHPPTIENQIFAVDENRPNGTVLGTLVANDPDVGDTLTYGLVGTSSVFAINATNGQITVIDTNQLNFESNPSFNLTVQVTDGGGLNDTATLTINLNNVNEAPVVNDQIFAIDENRPNGTVVGTVAVSDPDAGDTRNFTITGGTGNTAFAINNNTGVITVANSSFLDFETTPSFTLDLQVTDAGGLSDTAKITINLNDVNEGIQPFTLIATNPLSGATEVGTTFRPQIFFSEPVDTSTLNNNNFFASLSDQKIAATIVPANDGAFAWLFFNNPMPDASVIQVTVNGSTIKTLDGRLLDADGDGIAGGIRTFNFSTVSLAPVPNTSISGIIADPGADLKPMTADDFSVGPDGIAETNDDVFLLPIAGVEVYIIGLENHKVFTGSDGRFVLNNVPSGNVKVVVNGRTSTSPPSGFYFPEMVMDTNITPGTDNFVMMGMQEVYLPRIATQILQTVQANATTMVNVTAAGAPELPPEQQQFLTLEVQPNSLIGPDGKPLDNAQIGISTVPAELVRDMLPPGVLQHTFDITVQALGVTRFSTPAPMTFPNVFDAAPGSKLNFLSFSHETGRLEIEGTATVSADGKYVTTDPGTGITHPGWHGLTPPGGCGGSGGAPPPPPPPPTPKDTMNESDKVIPLISGESGSFLQKTWKAPDKLPDTPPPPPPPPGCGPSPRVPDPDKKQPYIQVTIQVDGPLADFMKQKAGTTEPLTGSSFTLSAGSGEKRSLEAVVKSYVEMAGILGGTNSAPFSQLNENILFGSKIIITEVTGKPDGSKHTEKTNYYLYRFIDGTDADHNDKQIEFEDTLVNGTRTKPISLKAGSATPQLSASGAFSTSGSTVQFKPTSVGLDQSGTLTIKTPTGKDVGTLKLKGDGEPKQKWFVDVSSFFNPDDFTDAIENAFANDMTTNEKLIFGTPNGSGTVVFDSTKASTFISDVIAEATGLLNPFSAGLERVTSSSSGTVDFDDWEAESLDLFDEPAPTLGYAFIVDNKNGQFNIDDIYNKRTIYSKAEQNFRLSEALNENYDGHVDVYLNRYFTEQMADWTRQQLVRSLGKTIAHELGHNVGLNHTNKFDSSDVMAQGFVLGAPKSFTTTANAFKIALGLPWSQAEGQQAVQYYSTYIQRGRGDAPDGAIDPDSQPPQPINDGLLWLLEDSSQNFVDTINFGNVNLTGSVATLNFVLANVGDQSATINNISLAGNTGQFTLSNFTSGLVLAPGTNTPITISFDPSVIGQSNATLVINSDALQPVVEIPLTGFGQSTTPYLSFNTQNNNLGGVAVVGGKVETHNLATITNYGTQPLSISDIKLVEGSSSFKLLDIANNLATNPITLNLGESWSFGVEFDPSKLGLDRAIVEITSNDHNNSKSRFSFVGTGLDTVVYPQWGNDYIAIETPNLANSSPLRSISDDKGNFQFFLPPQQGYHLTIFDPVTGLVTHSYGTTPQSGQGIDLTSSLVFNASKAADTDGDGLPDDIEFAIGTDAKKKDTNGDGISDFVAIQQGLNPLGDRGLPIGVVANLSLQGEAKEVVVEGSILNQENQTAYVATGSAGLAIIDASKFTVPLVLGQIDLPGDATDVALDSTLKIAAVATNYGGLQLVDVSNPMMPTLLKTLNLSANQVEVLDGIAYVTVGSSLKAVDLLSGDVLQTLSLGSSPLDSLAREGAKLYVTDSDNKLKAIDLSTGEMVAKGSLTLPNGGGKLFVGNGIAYIGAESFFQGGFVTANVADADHLTLISDSDVPSGSVSPAKGLIANGSGLGLSFGRLDRTNDPQPNVVYVMDTSDPQKTDQFISRINLPATPESAAIASGIAFVANGSNGLQVLNYLGFDNKGQTPTLTINSSQADLDPNTPGIQVLKGSSIPIQANIQDDVQVRNVELLVNGQVVRNDVSFPYDLEAIALNDDPNATTVTVQVMATDTGGNSTLSNVLTFNLVPDTFAPVVSSTTPLANTNRRQIPGISVRFNEALDANKLALSGITLTNLGVDGVLGGGDDTNVIPESFQLSATGRTLFIVPPADLAAGQYQLRLDPSIISDRSGNQITSPFTLDFGKLPILSLAYGETISDTLTAGDEDQVYTFQGTAGERLLFDGLKSDSYYINARLLSPSGLDAFNYSYYYNQQIPTNSDSQPFSLLETGTYQLIVSTSNNQTGDYSFRLLDIGQATPLTVGNPINDSIDPNSIKLYQISGTAGQKLLINGSDDNLYDQYVSVYKPDNSSLTSGYLPNGLDVTLPGNGNYLVQVSNSYYYNTDPKNYTIELIAPTIQTAALTLGNTVSSSISTPAEEDNYTFTGTAGQRLFFDGISNDSNYNINALLVSPSGEQTYNIYSTYSDSSPFSLSESGTYKLIIDATGNTTGNYSFRLLDLAAATPLTLNTAINQTVPEKQTDLYQFSGTAGEHLLIDSLGGDHSNSLILYGPNNQTVTLTSYQQHSVITLTGDGTYFLAVQSDYYYNTTSPDYSFQVLSGNFNPTSINLGDTVSGDTSGEADVYSFTGTAGQTLYFDGLSVDSYSGLELFSPSGNQLYYSNYTYSDSNPFTLTESGTYQLIVDNYYGSTSNYSFRLLNTANANPITVDAVGTTITDNLNPGRETDLYRFTGKKGQTLSLEGLGTNYNGNITLYSPANNYVTGVGLTGNNNSINITGDGTYLLAVQGYSYNNDLINYSFQIKETAFVDPGTVTGTAINIGDTVSSSISQANEKDIYTFTATAGQKLYFDGLDTGSYPNYANVSLLSPSGVSVPNFYAYGTYYNSQPVSLVETGTYQLTIQNSVVGNYSFRLLDPNSAQSLTLGSTITDTLNPGRASKLYQFTGQAGQKILFDYVSGSVNTNLYGPNNQSIYLNYYGNSEYILTGDGTYLLEVTSNSYDNGSVNYSFQWLNSATAGTTINVGDTITGSVNPAGTAQIYSLAGTAGQVLYLDGLDYNYYTGLKFISPSGNVLLNTGTSYDQNPFVLTETGTYQVIVDSTSGTTQNYSFRFLEPTTATPINPGQTVNGTLNLGTETAFYSFSGTAGQQVLLNKLDSNYNYNYSYAIYKPNSQSLYQSTGSAFTLPGDGTYLVAVQGNNYYNNAVNYQFQLVVPVVEQASLTIGNTVNGSLSTVGEQDVYTFTGTAGQRLFFDGLDSNSNTSVTLVSPSGSSVPNFYSPYTSYDSQPFYLLESGNYKLTVNSYYGATGNYSFRLLDLANASALSLGSPVSGTLTPGNSTQAFQFLGTSGQTISFDDLGSQQYGSYFYIYRLGNNQYISSGYLGFDTNNITLPGDGTYLLLVQGYNNTSPVTYNFRLV